MPAAGKGCVRKKRGRRRSRNRDPRQRTNIPDKGGERPLWRAPSQCNSPCHRYQERHQPPLACRSFRCGESKGDPDEVGPLFPHRPMNWSGVDSPVGPGSRLLCEVSEYRLGQTQRYGTHVAFIGDGPRKIGIRRVVGLLAAVVVQRVYRLADTAKTLFIAHERTGRGEARPARFFYLLNSVSMWNLQLTAYS